MISALGSTIYHAISYALSPFRSLYHLFSKTHTSSTNTSTPLEKKAVSIGRVENAGNTCFISVVLQELAAFPKYYDPIFFEKKYSGSQKELQSVLKETIETIRQGNTVPSSRIRHLESLLEKNGWSRPPFNRLRQILHRAFPSLFPLPIARPYFLYDSLIAIFEHKNYKDGEIKNHSYSSWKDLKANPNASSPIVLIDDVLDKNHSNYSVAQRLNNLIFPNHFNKKALWKIRVPINHRAEFSKKIKTATHQFRLRQMHYSPKNRHIATIRKVEKNWLSIDDDKIKPISNLTQEEAVLLIYESEPIQS